MESNLNLFSLLLLLGAAHGLFLALALLHVPTGNITAHRILAVITLILALDIGNEFLYQSRYYYQFPYLIWIDDTLEFLYGPLSLFYVHALTSSVKFVLDRQKWLHFLPVIIAMILAYPFYALDADSKLNFIYGETLAKNTELAYQGQELMVLMFTIQFAVYLFFGIRKLILHARQIRENFSYSEKINLSWLRYFYLYLVVMYLLFVLDVVVLKSSGINEQLNDLLYLLTVVMFYAMSYRALRQPTIYVQPDSDFKKIPAQGAEITSIASEEKLDYVDEEEKYKTSVLDANASQVLLAELLSYMDDEKPYLDSKLTLPALASELGISTNYLSQIINQQLNKNFFDFINSYRIEKAVQQLISSDGAKENVLTIALNSGFNSKTAFYTAFKKHTGMTPNQYRKSHAKEN